MNHHTFNSSRILLACVMAILIGVLVSPAAALATTRTVSPFGACSHMLWGYSNSDIDREMTALSAAGAKWLRVDVSWRDIETSDNVYNATLLKSLDYIISSAALRGITVQAVVMEFPGWANGGQGMWTPPTNDAKFGEFMQYMAGRYSGRIDYWELGNEVNETDFWNVPRASSPARYTSFLKVGYAGVKAGNANAKVISAGLAGSDDQYLQQMYDAGAKGSFDLLGVHAYTRGRSPYAIDVNTPSSTFDGLAIMKSTMDSNGDTGKNIWVTESGWQTSTVGYHVTPDQQAQYVYEAYQRVFQDFPYVETLFLYNLRNNGTATNATTDNFGMLNRDYSQKPAYVSYRQAVNAFMPQAISGTTTTTTTTTTATTTTTTTPTTITVPPVVTIRGTKPKAKKMTLSGTVTASLSTRVVVQRRKSGGWKSIKTVQLNGAGRYSLHISFGKRGSYQLRALSMGQNVASKSRSLRVRVR